MIAEVASERLPPDQPHDEVDPLVRREEPTELVHGDDVRVLELAGDLRLPDQPPLGVGGVREVVPHGLFIARLRSSDLIVDPVDEPHATGADDFADPIAIGVAGNQPRILARDLGLGVGPPLVRTARPADGGFGPGIVLTPRLEEAPEGRAVLGEESQVLLGGPGTPRPSAEADLGLDEA